MPTLRTRAGKGSDLTPGEADANFKRTVVQKTTTYACLVSDNRSVIEGLHATTAFTITLGDAATMIAAETGDYEVTITNIGAAVVTVAPAGSDTINGAATSLTLNQHAGVTLQVISAGNGWNIASQSGAVNETIAGSSLFAYKASDESVTSSTTLQDDDELTVTLAASATYQVDIQFTFKNTDSAPGVRFTVLTADSVGDGIRTRIVEGGSTTLDWVTVSGGVLGGTIATALTATFTYIARFDALIKTSTTGGVLKVQFAQNVSDVAATVLEAGGYIKATRIR